jgi:hypothetical protein
VYNLCHHGTMPETVNETVAVGSSGGDASSETVVET